jgi:hypothetical protein
VASPKLGAPQREKYDGLIGAGAVLTVGDRVIDAVHVVKAVKHGDGPAW